MCGFYCTDFREYMLAGKTLLGYTNLSLPNDYKNNDKTINKYLENKTNMISLDFRLKNRWIKKLSFRRNKR